MKSKSRLARAIIYGMFVATAVLSRGNTEENTLLPNTLSSGQASDLGAAEALRLVNTFINTFDSRIKQGVENGELSIINSQGRIGGEHFASVRESLLESWNIAQIVGINRTEPAVFSRLARNYLLFLIRTSTDYDEILKHVQKSFNEQLPNDPDIHYLFGLALFRQAEYYGDVPSYEVALKHLNQAIVLNPDFPEAYWLRSQIFAHQRNIEMVRADFDKVKETEKKFRPELFLYDMDVLAMIKQATGVN